MATVSSEEQFKLLLEQFWSWRLLESPEFCTDQGKHETNHLLGNSYPSAWDARYEKCKEFKAALSEIDSQSLLSSGCKLDYLLLKDSLDCIVEGHKWRSYSAYNSVTFLDNLFVDFACQLIEATPFNNAVDFEQYLKRLQCVPAKMAGEVECMKKAMTMGTTLHRLSVDGAVKQFKELLDTPIEKLCFYEPFKEKLENCPEITAEQTKFFRSSAADILSTIVLPSFQDVISFLEEEYIPRSRSSFGVSGLDHGVEYYKVCLRWHTTTSMTPEEVHALGVKEVARICTGMQRAMANIGFKGTIPEFFEHLKFQKEFFHSDGESLLGEYESLVNEQIQPKLADYFRYIPKMGLAIKPMPTNGPGGMYNPGASDGSRPGVFMVNVMEPETKPRCSMLALSLHEASPGHHFQFSHMLERPDLYDFRKNYDFRRCNAVPCIFPYYNAYLEGWGLYAEFLGEEMGVYRDEYDMLGRYSDEMLRAARLVVDTGLHVFGWEPERAKHFMRQHTNLPEIEITEEVERYLTWPGQACSYKIGELKIKELRSKAEDSLGTNFSIKAFHDVILDTGPVPLDILEQEVTEWIQRLI